MEMNQRIKTIPTGFGYGECLSEAVKQNHLYLQAYSSLHKQNPKYIAALVHLTCRAVEPLSMNKESNAGGTQYMCSLTITITVNIDWY